MKSAWKKHLKYYSFDVDINQAKSETNQKTVKIYGDQ